MSRRYRLHKFALGCVLVLSLAALPLGSYFLIDDLNVEPDGYEDREQSPPSDAATDGAIEEPTASNRPGSDEIGDAHQAQADSPSDTERESHWSRLIAPQLGDTLAQWIMAAFGIAATLISAYAVVLLRDTLRATRAAVQESQRSSAAAEKAAEATVADVKLTHRGYLFVNRVNLNRHRNTPKDGEPESYIRISIPVENTGRTPVIIRRLELISKVIPSGSSSYLDWNLGNNVGWDKFIPLGAGTIMEIAPPLHATLDCSERIYKNEVEFYFLVRIDYVDMFDETSRHHTQICFQMHVLAEPSHLLDMNRTSEAAFLKHIAFSMRTSFCSVS